MLFRGLYHIKYIISVLEAIFCIHHGQNQLNTL